MGHERPRGSVWTLLALALAIALALPWTALADETVADGDGLTPITNQNLSFGTVCAGSTTSKTVLIAVKRNGNAGSQNVFSDGSDVTVSVSSIAGSGLTAVMGTPNAISLPANWGGQANNTMSDAVSSTVTLLAGASDSFSGSVTFRGRGTSSRDGSTINRDDVVQVTATVVQCDTTAPVITPNVSGTLGLDGWYVGDVTVSWTVTDPESSITSTTDCGPTTINADTAGTTLTCTATSGGGTSSQSVTIKRDATPPTIAASLDKAPASTGWYNASTGAPTVSFVCGDATSGVAPGACPESHLFGEGVSQSYSASVADRAGNRAGASVSGVDVDLTPPTITFVSRTPANGYGWSNSDVIVNWSCADGVSGPVAAGVSSTVSAEGESQSVVGTCVDKAGNSAYNTQGGINIDKTKPTATITTPANDSIYTLGQAVPASYSCGDDRSGVSSCVGLVPSGASVDTGSVGTKAFVVDVTDKAGNTSSASVTYTVRYGLCVLYDQSKAHRSGSTVPIKLQLCDASGANVSSASIAVAAQGLVKVDNSASSVVEDSGNANPDGNFRYDAALGGYIFNLSTKGLTTGTWKLPFDVAGQSSSAYYVKFDVK